jgi:hypothetical protein
MKIFSSEFAHNYKSYSFGYANYCLKEKGDKLNDIYSQGYLPYSGSPNVKDIFYMARSARLPLADFSYTSGNRRVDKKFSGKFKRQSFKINDFNVKDKEFIFFCSEYFNKRHGPAIMPEERLKTILNSGLITDIVVYSDDEKTRAYVFEVSDKHMKHFWYSFYDLSLVYQSLGMWLLLDSASNAKEKDRDYFYVGTVYGEKALYKTAFKNLEYWDGERWVGDIKKLKHLGRTDNQRSVAPFDLYKQELELF